MASLQPPEEFISERLIAAAEEICKYLRETIVRCEQEPEPGRQRSVRDTGGSIKPQMQLKAVGQVTSWREFISECLSVTAEEICRHVEETIAQYEGELDRQRTTLDPPRHLMSEHRDFSDHKNSLSVKQEEPEPPQVKEEEELCPISQEEEELHVKEEADPVMVTPDEGESPHTELDLNGEMFLTQSFNWICNLVPAECRQEETMRVAEEEMGDTNRGGIRDRNQLRGLDISTTLQSREQYGFRKNSCHHNTIEALTESKRKEKDSSRESERTCRDDLDSSTLVSLEKTNRDLTSKYDHLTKVPTGEKPSPYDQTKRQTQKSSPVGDNRANSKRKPVCCDQCGKLLRSKRSLEDHSRTHTGEKPFPCDLCPKRFSVKCSLIGHMRTHTGERPFLCKECPKRFSLSSNFLIHMRTHTGERPFSCTQCNMKFRRKDHLKSHTRTHTGEKAYECKQCQMGFSRKKYLVLHLKTHRR